MIPRRKKCYVAFAVEPHITPEERIMQIRRHAVRHKRIASASTHVYIRFTHGIADAVVLSLHNASPMQYRDSRYMRVDEWLASGARHEFLDTHQEAA